MIENIPNEISTIERIEEFKAVAQVSDLGICYDTGHGHLQRNTKSFESVRATHVHDNNGESDEHLWPFEGTLNWPSLIDKLILADYKGPLMFETRGDLAKSGEVRSRLDELWDEASTSAEEFRMKYKLNSDNENEAHLY